MASNNSLTTPKRYITSHNKTGQSVISQVLPCDLSFQLLPTNDAAFSLVYATRGSAIQLNDDKDLDVYKSFLASPPGLTIADGTVLRYVDMAPGITSPMHRTVSLDYGVVLEGEVELILSSGDRRVLSRGDVCVQRATMHAWRNLSDKDWARVLFMLQPSTAPIIQGSEVGEDYGGMKGVPTSH